MTDDQPGARLERCPSCLVARWFVRHPAGWRCRECSTCVSSFQSVLPAFDDGSDR